MAERIRGPRAVVGIRRRAVEVSTRAFEPRYQRYFRQMATKAVSPGEVSRLTADYLRTVSGPSARADLKQILDQQYTTMTQTVWEDVVGVQVGRSLAFDLDARGVERVLDKVATRVTAITESSQRMIAERVESEIARGSNADVLEKSLQDLLRSWGEDGGRAHIIALTESGNAYNAAAIEGYRESGLVETVQVYDGPECGWTEHDDPDLADGSTRTLDEADEYPLSHPHCQRAFGPVVLTEEVPASPEAEEPPAPEEPPPAPEPVQGLPDDVARHLEMNADKILSGVNPDQVPGYAVGDAGSVLHRNWDVIAGLHGESLQTVLTQAEAVLQQTADEAILSTRRSSGVLEKILADGRFKSQFETGRSAGAYAPNLRANAERYMFGYADDLPVERRPLYGYLRDPKQSDGASWYGDALMDLRPAVRERTTVVWADSLGSIEQPSPLTKIRASSFNPSRMGSPRPGQLGYPYTEAQIHGGLKAEDILRVTFDQTPTQDSLRKALKTAGFREVETGPQSVWERVP